MKGNNTQKNTNSFLGVPTPAKASGGIFTLAAIVPIFVSFVFIILISVMGLAKEGYDKTDWYLYVSYLMSPISILMIAIIYFRFLNKPIVSVIKQQKCAAKYYIWALVLQAGLICLSLLTSWFLAWLEKFGYKLRVPNLPNMDGFGFVGALFCIALLPAIFEELLFREMLLKGMGCFGTVGAALFCGGLFALFHQNPAQTVYQFCCGVGFALLAIRARSILPTVVSHFINNALIITLEKYRLTEFSLPVTLAVLCVSAVCLALAVWYLVFRDKNTPWKEETLSAAEKGKERKTFWLFAAVGVLICSLGFGMMFVKGF